jgi:tRNA(Ile)-lysidine synthase
MSRAPQAEFPPLAAALLCASRHPAAAPLTRALRVVPRGGVVCVAASGGADSTALALLTRAVLSRGHWSMCLATVDHGLRAESPEDVRFVGRLAQWLQVPCHVETLDLARGASLADRARRRRYQALSGAAMRAGASVLLTAHHAEDQLETMLLRLARGAGPRAVGGMRAQRRLKSGVIVVRPLLESPRRDLAALLAKVGAPWREDPTNADPSRPRARLRAAVLPVLESLHPGAAVRASRAAGQLRASGARFEREARALMVGAGPWDRASCRRGGAALLAVRLRQLSPRAKEREIAAAVRAIRDRGAKPRELRVGARRLQLTAKELRWI